MNSHFAMEHLFANLSLRKPFLSKTTIWPLLVLDKLFFIHFLTFKNYKHIEETAQIFFNQACTEYCIANAKHI